jgi:hypothetical protein
VKWVIKPLKLTPISIEFFIPKNGKKKKNGKKMATIWQQFDNNLAAKATNIIGKPKLRNKIGKFGNE